MLIIINKKESKKTAQAYLIEKDLGDFLISFDVCEVYLEGKMIHYIKNAFGDQMKKKELLLYFNFINLSNKIILDFCENLDMDNFFDLDRKIFDKLTKKNREKIFSKKNLEDFKTYKEKVIKGN